MPRLVSYEGMNSCLRWLLISLVAALTASSCERDETDEWLKHRIWSSTMRDPGYSCDLFSFGKRPPCAALLMRIPGPDKVRVQTGTDWVTFNGRKVVDDGKLTVYWMKGGTLQTTVIQSGALYDILRSPDSGGGTLEKLDFPVLDAFYAEHAK